VSFAINMPTTISAGPTTFEVTNNSDIEHNFEVEGQGIEQVFDTNLQPGETRTMTIDLPPGTYEVYCPVGNHADMGMRLTLTVTEAGAETPAEGEATPPPPAEATPEAEMTPEATEEVAAQMVPVELVSFAINMPVSISAGPTTFEVTNTSDMEHNFEVEGQGIEQVFDTNLQPGETRTMTIDLPPGTYEVYCPVSNHADMGMQLTLTVGE